EPMTSIRSNKSAPVPDRIPGASSLSRARLAEALEHRLPVAGLRRRQEAARVLVRGVLLHPAAQVLRRSALLLGRARVGKRRHDPVPLHGAAPFCANGAAPAASARP